MGDIGFLAGLACQAGNICSWFGNLGLIGYALNMRRCRNLPLSFFLLGQDFLQSHTWFCSICHRHFLSSCFFFRFIRILLLSMVFLLEIVQSLQVFLGQLRPEVFIKSLLALSVLRRRRIEVFRSPAQLVSLHHRVFGAQFFPHAFSWSGLWSQFELVKLFVESLLFYYFGVFNCLNPFLGLSGAQPWLGDVFSVGLRLINLCSSVLH